MRPFPVFAASRIPFRRGSGRSASTGGHDMTNRFTTAQSIEAIRRRWSPAIVPLAAMAALMAITTALPADAAPRQARPEHTAEATAPRDAGEPIMAIVSIKSQKVTFYDAAGWILARRCRPGPRDAKRLPGSSASYRRTRTTARASMTMPGCRTCCASPGMASRCTAGRCPDIRPRTAACACRWLCGEAVRQGAHRHAHHHLAERCGAGRALPSGAVRAERKGRRGCSGACRDARPRGGRGHQDGFRGEERRRSRGAGGGAARGGAAQAGIGQGPRRRCARCRREGARRRQDGPGQGTGRGPRQKAAAKVAELQAQLDTAKANAKAKLDAAAAAQEAGQRRPRSKRADAAKAAERGEARAREPVSGLHQPRDAKALRGGATRISGCSDGGELFDLNCDHRGLGHESAIPTSRYRHACVLTAMARTAGACAGARSKIRRRRRRQGRARPDHHSAGCARPHRADRIATILDHHLG